MMLAPKGTPRAIVDRLNREANAAMASDEVKERLVEARHRCGGKLDTREHGEIHPRRSREMGADREGDRRAGGVSYFWRHDLSENRSVQTQLEDMALVGR